MRLTTRAAGEVVMLRSVLQSLCSTYRACEGMRVNAAATARTGHGCWQYGRQANPGVRLYSSGPADESGAKGCTSRGALTTVRQSTTTIA